MSIVESVFDNFEMHVSSSFLDFVLLWLAAEIELFLIVHFLPTGRSAGKWLVSPAVLFFCGWLLGFLVVHFQPLKSDFD